MYKLQSYTNVFKKNGTSLSDDVHSLSHPNRDGEGLQVLVEGDQHAWLDGRD